MTAFSHRASTLAQVAPWRLGGASPNIDALAASGPRLLAGQPESERLADEEFRCPSLPPPA